MDNQTIIQAAFPWLTVLIAGAACAAFLLCLIRPLRVYAREYALAVSLTILAGYVGALITGFTPASAGAVQLAEAYSWIPSIGASIAWGVNGMGVAMIGLAVFLVPIVILAGWNDVPAEKQGSYFGWILFLEAIMIALFAARDVFLFYILFELMIVPMYFLIGSFAGSGRERAAMKFLLYSILGGLIMLVGVIALYVMGPGGEQNYLLSALSTRVGIGEGRVQMLLFLSFFIGFAIKAPMWPLHTWLPDTTEKAPAGVSTLLVGVLDKLGTFGMIAICIPLFPQASAQAAPVIIAFAVISIFWGAFMAIASDNLMRLIAYTSVSHFGFMIMGIFSGSAIAMTGSILYMVAHGIATAALFLIVGFLGERGGSHQISAYGGWQRVTPLIAGTFLVAGLATIALPGLSGFIPEYLVLMGTFEANMLAGLIAVVGVVFAAVYILLPYQRIFTGPKPEGVKVPDLNAREKTVMGVLIAAMLGLGFYPAPILDIVNPVSSQVSVSTMNDSATMGAASAIPLDGAIEGSIH